MKEDKCNISDRERGSVVDPDLYVFGPPGSASGSVSHMYGSGDPDPSIIKQIVRKTLISTVQKTSNQTKRNSILKIFPHPSSLRRPSSFDPNDKHFSLVNP
jgi:hypothetical protein